MVNIGVVLLDQRQSADVNQRGTFGVSQEGLLAGPVVQSYHVSHLMSQADFLHFVGINPPVKNNELFAVSTLSRFGAVSRLEDGALAGLLLQDGVPLSVQIVRERVVCSPEVGRQQAALQAVDRTIKLEHFAAGGTLAL